MKLTLFILYFSLSLINCKGQEKSNQLVELTGKYLDISFSKIPYFLCDYYYEFDKFPSSKQDFQWFLKEIEGEEQVYKTLNSLSYGFKLNELEGEIFLYEFGFDNDDDKAKIRYFIDDSVSNKQDGDLVILRFSIKDCLPRIRKYKSVFQAYRDQEKISLNKEFTDSVKKEVIKSIDYLNQEGVFLVPKEPNDLKNISFIEANFKFAMWKFNVIENEHSMEELYLISENLNSFFENNKYLIDLNINKIIIPIEYYSKYQIERF